jgi:hypothetical protein
MAPAAYESASEECATRARGLTVEEFFAIGSGCLMIDDGNTQTHCMALDKKLRELSPNLGDGRRDQAAAVWDCADAGLAATSIPSVNLTP